MQVITRIFFGLILNLLFVSTYSQIDICEENATGVYWPVKKGIKRHYFSQSGPYVSYFNGDSLKVGDNTYYKQIEEYGSSNDKIGYYREQNGNVYIYDAETKIEFLELSNNINPGYTWEKYDKSWKYTVVDTTSKVSTPYCEYSNLLKIKAEPQGNTRNSYSSYFNLYYKRGVGLVSLDVEGKGFSFLSIDKSLINEINYMAPGCENFSSENERNQCTSEKITEFIDKNFSYTGKIKRGILKLKFLINEKGEVENVSAEHSIKNAQGQTDEAIRIIKLMKFVPRYVNGKPYKTHVIQSVTF